MPSPIPGGPFPLAYHGLGDLFVFVFFGLVAVGGTYWVQALSFGPEVLWAGAGMGALATAILVVNNLRDIKTDAQAGKRTLAVRDGVPGNKGGVRPPPPRCRPRCPFLGIPGSVGLCGPSCPSCVASSSPPEGCHDVFSRHPIRRSSFLLSGERPSGWPLRDPPGGHVGPGLTMPFLQDAAFARIPRAWPWMTARGLWTLRRSGQEAGKGG